MKNNDRKTSFILFLIGILPFLYLTIDLCLIEPSAVRTMNNPNMVSHIQKSLSNILYQNDHSNLFIKKQIAKKPMKHWQNYLQSYRNYFEGILMLDSKGNTLFWVTMGSIYKTKPDFNITNHLESNKHFIMYDSLNQKKWTYSKKGNYSIEEKLNHLLISTNTNWEKVSPSKDLDVSLSYMNFSTHSKSRKYRICQLQKFGDATENYTLIFIKKPNFLLEKIDANISKNYPNYLITISPVKKDQKIKLKYHYLTDLESQKLNNELEPLQKRLKGLQVKLKSTSKQDKKEKSLLRSQIESTLDKLERNRYLLRKKEQLDKEKLFRYKVLEIELNEYKIELYDNKSALFRARVEKLVSKPSWQLLLLFVSPIAILFILFYRYAKKDENYLLQNDWVDYLAHEIQTPIHGINICTELLLDSKDDNLVKLIHNQAIHLSYVAKAFVRSVQTQKFQLVPKKVDSSLFEIIDNAWDMVSKVHEDKTPILNKIGEDQMFFLDSKMFQEIFINLMDNSCKYCAETPAITIDLKLSHEGLEIIIKDNGIGIEKKNYKNVLQKSFRIQNQWNLGVTGTGMGLYLTNEMVLSHQGSFTIYDSGTNGTTFKINLPS
ncbi:MAG: hypothetical protein KC646_07625 [Candidatus Cloacimonetes bacterium]|nr:hypothetical protein [Candidatus Cloacimonadota bacterium]